MATLYSVKLNYHIVVKAGSASDAYAQALRQIIDHPKSVISNVSQLGARKNRRGIIGSIVFGTD